MRQDAMAKEGVRRADAYVDRMRADVLSHLHHAPIMRPCMLAQLVSGQKFVVQPLLL